MEDEVRTDDTVVQYPVDEKVSKEVLTDDNDKEENTPDNEVKSLYDKYSNVPTICIKTGGEYLIAEFVGKDSDTVSLKRPMLLTQSGEQVIFEIPMCYRIAKPPERIVNFRKDSINQTFSPRTDLSVAYMAMMDHKPVRKESPVEEPSPTTAPEIKLVTPAKQDSNKNKKRRGRRK